MIPAETLVGAWALVALAVTGVVLLVRRGRR